MAKPTKKTALITSETALALRKKLGLNQSDFWRPLGVTQSGGSRYESGRTIPKPVRQGIFLRYQSGADQALLDRVASVQ